MLKGLAFRQAFMAANAALGIVLVVLVALIASTLFRGGIEPGPTSTPDANTATTPLKLAHVDRRDRYDAIAKRGLFGAAGAYDPTKKPAPPKPAPVKPVENTESTRLPLKLFGTALGVGPRSLSAAIIEVKDGLPKTGTYYPDDEVLTQVFLKEVRRAEVILDNRRTQRLERLTIEHESKPRAGGRSVARRNTPMPSVNPTGNRPTLITLNREDITRKLEEEYARVASTMNVRVVRDKQGGIKGVTTDNIEQYAIAQELGFKNGDVLVSINNEPVDSREKAGQVLQKYRNASIFRIGVLRNNQPVFVTYRVR